MLMKPAISPRRSATMYVLNASSGSLQAAFRPRVMLGQFAGINFMPQPVNDLAILRVREPDDEPSRVVHDGFHKFGIRPPATLRVLPTLYHAMHWRRRAKIFSSEHRGSSYRQPGAFFPLPGPAEIGRGFQPHFELVAALGGFLRGIQFFGQAEKPALQFRHAHVLRTEIDVEQRAKFPRLVPDQPSFLLQAPVKRRARECGQKRDLHLVQTRVPHKIKHLIEHLRRVAVQPRMKQPFTVTP